MNLLWLILLLLHQGYTLIPVTIVQLGDTATLKFFLENEKKTSTELHWYKQSAGNTLRLILKLTENGKPDYESKLFASRLNATYERKMSTLTIWKAAQDDEGMYHCALIDWHRNNWQGTYLLIKGNTVGSSNYTVVQTATVSAPVRPGDSVNLQCSVFSDSDKKTCSGDLSLFWVRARDKSLPNIIYTDGNRANNCEKNTGSRRRCVYNFSKTVNASDAGTYYCAVATCGEILFGNGTQLDVKASSLWSQVAGKVIIFLFAALGISLVVTALLIWSIQNNKCVHCKAGAEQQKPIGRLKPTLRFEGGRLYSAVVFATINSDWARLKKGERKRIYTAVKTFGLN